MVVALYVPGDRPDRFEKAAAAGADMVILDLEDAVASAAKGVARSAVREWASVPREIDLQVRVNAPGSVEYAADLQMVAGLPAVVGLRLPKVDSPIVLDEVVAACPGRPVHCLVESARGVQNLAAIADHGATASVALGEADLRADLRGAAPSLVAVIRAQLIIAAAAAGLPAPLMAAYPDIANLAGLRESCYAGKDFGFGGRTAIHPTQVPVIRQAFTPEPESVRWAREVLEVLGGGGAGVLANGEMVDEAMVRRAHRILEDR